MFRVTEFWVVVLCVGSLYGVSAEQAAKPLHNIEVTAPADVASGNKLNDALSLLSEKVSACVKAGKDPKTCQCSYQQELLKLLHTYAMVIAQHPEWNDK